MSESGDVNMEPVSPNVIELDPNILIKRELSKERIKKVVERLDDIHSQYEHYQNEYSHIDDRFNQTFEDLNNIIGGLSNIGSEDRLNILGESGLNDLEAILNGIEAEVGPLEEQVKKALDRRLNPQICPHCHGSC